MKKIQSIALMMAIALTGTVGFTACSSEDIIDENVVYDSNGNAGVKSEFVISIPRSVVRTTRMSGAITQNAGTEGQFRGIDNISLIPFSDTPTGTSEKNADVIGQAYHACKSKKNAYSAVGQLAEYNIPPIRTGTIEVLRIVFDQVAHPPAAQAAEQRHYKRDGDHAGPLLPAPVSSQ